MKQLDRKYIPLIAAVLCSVVSRLFIKIEAVSSLFMLAALFFILYAARRAEGKKQFRLVFAAASVSCFARNITYYGTEWVGILAVFGLSLVVTLVRMLAYLTDSWLMKKKSCFIMTFAYPVTASLIEFAIDRFGFGNIINPVVALHSYPLVLQSAVFLGEYGLMFLLFWFMSLLVFAVQEKGRRILPLSVCAAMLAGILIFGGVRLSRAPEKPSSHIRVAFWSDRIEPLFDPSPISSEENIDTFIKTIYRSQGDGAEFLMFTEETLKLKADDVEPVLRRICAAAKECGVAVLAPFEVDNGEEKGENAAWFIDAGGQILCRYTKNTLVPVIETSSCISGDGKVGTFSTELGGRQYTIALAICFDGSNNVLMRTIPDDADILLLPSWEWDTGNLDQNRNQRIHSVQRDVTYIKVAVDGYIITYDQWGRNHVLIDERGREYVYDVADVPLFK